MSTEGSSYGDVGAWIAWRMRTFFIPCLAPCIIFMPNRGEMVFFGRGNRNCQGKGNLLLKGKETRHLYYFASIRLDSLQVCFRVCRGKKGKMVFFFIFLLPHNCFINKNKILYLFLTIKFKIYTF